VITLERTYPAAPEEIWRANERDNLAQPLGS